MIISITKNISLRFETRKYYTGWQSEEEIGGFLDLPLSLKRVKNEAFRNLGLYISWIDYKQVLWCKKQIFLCMILFVFMKSSPIFNKEYIFNYHYHKNLISSNITYWNGKDKNFLSRLSKNWFKTAWNLNPKRDTK